MVGGGGPQGRGPGDEDYGWLYGGRGRPEGQPPGPDDSTRVLPTQPPSGRDEPRSSLPPPTHIAATPTGPPPSARRPVPTGKRRRRFRLGWLWLLLLAYLAYLVAVPVYAWFKVSTVAFDPGGDRPADQPGTTYLVVGSDARAGLAGQRTDTIMLLHTGDGPPLLMSVPRDSLVEVPGHGVTKINASFSLGGPKLLVQTIEQSTGLRVDDYVQMGFDGLVELVDAVGGITICPDAAMNDPLAHLDIPKGCQEADGTTALGYARSRHTSNLGDIDRARHQREVVGAIGHEVLNWRTVVNPVRYWHVVTGGAGAVQIGDGTNPLDLGRFGYAMMKVDGSGKTCGVPIADLDVHWDEERSKQLFQLIAEDRTDEVGTDLCSPSGMVQ
jgi:LCP family protein required for cell wall assembly